jgi:hypothetical protein
VSLEEFSEYQGWQRAGRAEMPAWFMQNDEKAHDIMINYKKIEAHYKKA